MKFKVTINIPQTPFDGWTGFIRLPDGKRVYVHDYCGGAAVSFSTREKLMAALTRKARALAQGVPA